jgi:dTDP-4-dehydrorhamnose reductase
VTHLLVTGSRGQLGRALLAEAGRRGLDAEGYDLDTLDITDAGAVERLVQRLRPEVVINCAAITDVDGCESQPDLAMAVNGEAVGHLARACASAGAVLVQVSTDYVFSGETNRPWREEDPTAPLSVYGRSKLRGEEEARQTGRHLIVRTAWLFGPGGRNFVEAILGQIEAGRTRLQVVADQRGCPTYAPDLAAAILDLLEAGTEGLVHVANRGETTWHGFAQAIVELAGADVEVEPVATEGVPRPARRPRYSVLDTSRLRAILGRDLPGWRDALARYLEERCASW